MSQNQQQLELPPISFARYLNLLQRRKWQVLPMSLVGLLIGGCVAFLIPRYYVATTLLTYKGNIRADVDDPLLPQVLGADESIPNAVPEALMALSRIGSDPTDPERQSVIDAVTSRLEVTPYQRDKNRGYFNVSLLFKDTDGQFAADFCNEVRSVWVQQIKEELERDAAQALNNARNEVRRMKDARDLKARDLNVFIEKHQINAVSSNAEYERTASAQGQLSAQQQEQTRLEAEVGGLQRKIKRLEERLELIQPQRDAKISLQGDPELLRQYTALQAALQDAEAKFLGVNPGHSQYAARKARYEQLQALVAEMEAGAVGSGVKVSTEKNPDWVAAKRELDDAQTALEFAQAQLEIFDRKVHQLEQEVATLPGIFAKYQKLQTEYEDRQDKYDAAAAQEVALERIAQEARQGQPFTVSSVARVPPAPTEPNITLVAIMGALLGLAAAIGLVLLLDFLRSTFKTVEDVKYALRVPVLGTMAHVETVADRIATVRQRRRVSLVAASFLLASVSLLTIYYLAPTRLPLAVLQALNTILGPAE